MFEYVNGDPGVEELTHKVRAATRVCVDTEANSLHNYHERVCLLQLSIDDEHFIVDPLADIALDPFFKVLKRKELIFHGADYDLRLLRSTFGFIPERGVFDTMLAAQLLGMDRLGYAALVEHYFDKLLPKVGQKSNWARRPLSESQLKYAMDDTRYLQNLADELHKELASLGRDAWHKEWCKKAQIAASIEPKRDDEDAWRIRGVGLLERKQLTYLRELWAWRDHEASSADRPPFKIMGNQPLIDLAIWAAAHPGSPISKGPKLPRHCEGRRLKAIERAIKKAERMPKAKWPERRRRQDDRAEPAPELKSRVRALRDALEEVAAELGIGGSVIAPKAILVEIARNEARTPAEMKACSPIMDWQAKLLEKPARKVLGKK